MQTTISFSTKFGWISATEIDNNVTKVQFGKIRKKGILSKNLKKVKIFLELYCKKKTKKTKIPIKIIGNKFQKKIWNELRKIRKGKTKTYGEIAKKLNISPRYVGRVCGENKHVLIIPCHRVIRSDGSFGGFSAPNGLKLKEKLLKFEKD